MKYQIRKAAKVTTIYSTCVIELEPEDFRNHENNPYQGNSEEEFILYLRVFNSEDTDGLSDESYSALMEIFDHPELNIIYSTTEDCEDSWLEIGEKNPQCRKAGGFDCRYTSK